MSLWELGDVWRITEHPSGLGAVREGEGPEGAEQGSWEARRHRGTSPNAQAQRQEQPRSVKMNRWWGGRRWLCQLDISARHQLGVIWGRSLGESQFRESDRQGLELPCQEATMSRTLTPLFLPSFPQLDCGEF